MNIIVNSKIEIKVKSTTALNVPTNHKKIAGKNITIPRIIAFKSSREITRSQMLRKINTKNKLTFKNLFSAFPESLKKDFI
ncbi:hypothetical protein A2870_01470 [Candidatus Curtissbacteria bacterium RIFCSPHIGHO2_01_FULL_41_11]|uniref:Uncharacterized protein n=1 Tax=Candidatus Curtissbacteria bacterium RIFCSPHIGHO2_01_FULL_41_11 TaxID=1797711 RepID=A0A1F5G697_9BACT|nr:MAG: hypothetical protein A2870_01470 [Candidatus Curtissbacteria bacterium RIFCSPHIGHO2_01_FULL_41_11]